VDQYYAAYLHHAADAAGRAYWVGQFLAGASETDIQTDILTSAEYQAAHAADDAFVAALYQDVLGHAPDTAGQAAWLNALHNGQSRQDVSQGLVSSVEKDLEVIDALYRSVLGRPADSAGEQNWLNQLRNGLLSLDGFAEALLGSAEFFMQAH
jgi:hypothetical protein